MEGLADRIRQARRRRGWTQEMLASAVGVTRSAVAQWETGRSGQLTSNLARISRALDADLAELVSSVATPESPLNGSGAHPRGRLGADALGDEKVRLGDELALLRLYRRCLAEDQRLLLMTARRLSQKSDEALDQGAAD